MQTEGQGSSQTGCGGDNSCCQGLLRGKRPQLPDQEQYSEVCGQMLDGGCEGMEFNSERKLCAGMVLELALQNSRRLPWSSGLDAICVC